MHMQQAKICNHARYVRAVFVYECAGEAGWFGVQGKEGAPPCKETPLRRQAIYRPKPPRHLASGDARPASGEQRCAPLAYIYFMTYE